MFGEGSILFGIHPVLVDKIDDHYLSSEDRLPDFFPVLFFLLVPESIKLAEFFLSHSLGYFIEFVLLCLAALVISLFFQFEVIQIPFNFLDLFLMLLSFGFIIFRLLFLVANELLNALFEDV